MKYNNTRHCGKPMDVIKYRKINKFYASMTLKCVVCGITKSHIVILKG